MQKVAISIGDINGIGLEIALKSHKDVKKICKPIYCINKTMLYWGAAYLGLDVPDDFKFKECGDSFEITPGISTKEAGKLSYESFKSAIKLAKRKEVKGVVTLPINKESWKKANVPYIGHTDMLGSDTIMMLGCEKMFVILFTHHIALRDVPGKIKKDALVDFFKKVAKSLKAKKIGVLGLNPHAGDNGLMGDEEKAIKKAIKKVNKELNSQQFIGPMVPDTAFIQNFTYFIAMYHDQGLAPLKALYFEESINVTLNAKILRTSVDHGTAFDIAYKDKNPSNKSYINAIKYLLSL